MARCTHSAHGLRKCTVPTIPLVPSGTLSRPRPAVDVLVPLTIYRACAQSHAAAPLPAHIVAMAIGPASFHVFFRDIQHRLDVVLPIQGPLVRAYKTREHFTLPMCATYLVPAAARAPGHKAPSSSWRSPCCPGCFFLHHPDLVLHRLHVEGNIFHPCSCTSAGQHGAHR